MSRRLVSFCFVFFVRDHFVLLFGDPTVPVVVFVRSDVLVEQDLAQEMLQLVVGHFLFPFECKDGLNERLVFIQATL